MGGNTDKSPVLKELGFVDEIAFRSAAGDTNMWRPEQDCKDVVCNLVTESGQHYLSYSNTKNSKFSWKQPVTLNEKGKFLHIDVEETAPLESITNAQARHMGLTEYEPKINDEAFKTMDRSISNLGSNAEKSDSSNVTSN